VSTYESVTSLQQGVEFRTFSLIQQSPTRRYRLFYTDLARRGGIMANACEHCGAPMIEKTAKRGPNTGERFWGCSKWTPQGKHSSWSLSDARAKGREPSQRAPKPSSPRASTAHQGNADMRRKVQWFDAADRRLGWLSRYASAGARLRALPEALVEAVTADLSTCWIAASDLPSYSPADDATLRTIAMMRKVLQRGSLTFTDPRVEDLLLARAAVPTVARGAGLVGTQPVKTLDPTPLQASLDWWRKSTIDRSLDLDSEEESAWLHSIADDSPLTRRLFAQAPLEALVTGLGHETSGNRRVDFLFAGSQGPVVIEIDGAQHQGDQVDEERDALLRLVGVHVERITTRAAIEGATPECLKNEGLTAAESGNWHDLVHGPIQVQRLALALLEALRRGFLAGNSWIVEVEDPTGIAADSIAPILDLLRAVDDLWGGRLMPDFAQFSDSTRTRAWTWDKTCFVEAEPQPELPDIRIRLDLGLGPLHSMPEIGALPEIVVRDAPLPIRILEATGEPSTRGKPQIPEEELVGPLRTILRSVFAVEDFRDGQLEAITEVVCGRDCVVLLPTGAGKSLIYQLAGLVLPGRTLVVDPLVSLMEDQQRSLRTYGIDRVLAFSSFTTQSGHAGAALAQVQSGDALFIFISPERLQMPDFRRALRVLAASTPVNLAVVDEAHCVSEWGHDFRTAYLNVGRTLREYGSDAVGSPPPLLALTGTASRAVLKDVLNDLAIRQSSSNTLVKPRTFDRAELTFEIRQHRPVDAMPSLAGIVLGMPSHFGENPAAFFAARPVRPFPGLIFVPHANGAHGVQAVAEVISKETGSEVLIYSGQAPKHVDRRAWESSKREAARRFMADEVPLMVSTKAFGMGIDKPNIRYVVHFGIPGSIESYYQEVGRAGRDRKQARCVLIVSELDARRNSRLLDDGTALDDLHAHIASRPKGGQGSDDVDRQLFFFTRSFQGVESEVASVTAVLDDLEPLDDTHTCQLSFGEITDDKERALYRLALLGVVQDYTVDHGAKRFEVTVRASTPEGIAESLTRFIERSQPGRSAGMRDRVLAASRGKARDAIEQCSRHLTEFIYDTVALARRRSLREMLLAARESADDAEFRRRLLDYLQEGDVAPLIESLADATHFELDAWVRALDSMATADDAQEWRGSTARLLTSYPEQPGLLVARGFSELVLIDGDIEQGASNIAAGLRSARDNYRSTPEAVGDATEALMEKLLLADRHDEALAVVLAARPVLDDATAMDLEGRIRQVTPALPGLAVLDLTSYLEDLLATLDQITQLEAWA
jgi:ATP-dependent DNA helicase RecQ